jgi:hypothetical protein
MSYTIDSESRLVRFVGTGVLTDDELVGCITRLRADPRIEPGMNSLSDMREIEVGFTTDGVSRVIDVMTKTRGRRGLAKAAIVVSSDVAFGMGRMLELRAGELDPSFRIFRDMDAAREWVGAEPDPPRG